MSTPTFVQDVTLRDGMHAVRHRMTPKDVKRIVVALDDAGVGAIEVAHGDGLACGSVNHGPGSNTDCEWTEAAASPLRTWQRHARSAWTSPDFLMLSHMAPPKGSPSRPS